MKLPSVRGFAYYFAVYEHNFSRILFLSLLTTYAFFYDGNMQLVDIMLKCDIGVWLLYWLSHNLEKISFAMSRKKSRG